MENQEDLNKAISLYKEKIKKEPYQKLSSLIEKLNNLFLKNTNQPILSPYQINKWI